MIQFFYGDGKGKSTALLGGAVRMAGSGGKVLYVQFFKNNDSSEVIMLKNMENVTYLPQDVLYTMAFDNKEMEEQMKKIKEGYNKKIEEVYELQNK
ncbi:MAG TPA: cob(I)yrinic acid a c-diamide adenosyltransferase, partial [Eubacterium sp.]|nr:cob(I)yrinic acid a c-diamide adenosyltransferase [Eubacterium sp.]